MDAERNEDLNPRSDEIEKKIDAMLDPSIPDVPDLDDVQPAENVGDEPAEKIIVLKSPSSARKKVAVSDAPSAPELPAAETVPLPPSAKSSKRVIIPIDHGDDAKEQTVDPLLDNAPRSQLAREKVVKPPFMPTSKIPADTSEELAEKLDEAIAGLTPDAAKSDSRQDVLPSAPELTDEEIKQQLDTLSAEVAVSSDPADITDKTSVKDELPLAEPAVISDPKTDKAVAEIMAAESDEILEIEDAVRDTDEPIAVPKKPRRSLGKVLVGLFKKPAFRWAVVFVLLIGTAVVAVVPTARYFVLNAAGVRVAGSLTVLDESTRQPLKNVEVSLGESTGKTDDTGKVTLKHVRPGKNLLTINKRAFAPITKTVILGWGSNPLGDFSLSPTGTQYTIQANDFLSGQPLGKVTATSGQADATADDKGVIKLTIERLTDAEFTVALKLDGYRSEELVIKAEESTPQTVRLVPAKKHVYVSKRSGKFDVYSAYIDGKEEKILLPGSGNERDGMVLIPHPRDNLAAYISTRPGQRNPQGNILSNMVIINLDDGETTNVVSSEQIKVVSWNNDRLVYAHVADGAGADNPERYWLTSYNHQDGSTTELAKSNFFNDVIGIGSTIYYAPSSAYQAAETSLYRVNNDGRSSSVLHNKEVWSMFRTSYDTIALSVQQEWFNFRIGDKEPTKLNAAPADQTSRIYIDSPDGKRSAWIDSRDGKGVLLVYDLATKADTTLKSESGVSYPVRWLNDSVLVYRVKNNQETADYAININGGEAFKINDVTSTAGFARWLN